MSTWMYRKHAHSHTFMDGIKWYMVWSTLKSYRSVAALSRVITHCVVQCRWCKSRWRRAMPWRCTDSPMYSWRGSSRCLSVEGWRLNSTELHRRGPVPTSGQNDCHSVLPTGKEIHHVKNSIHFSLLLMDLAFITCMIWIALQCYRAWLTRVCLYMCT